MKERILLKLFIFVILFDFGNTCSCFPTSVEQKYCDADFVLKVKVRSELIPSSPEQNFNDYYKIRIKDTWKFKFENLVDKMNRVYTASNGALCGVYLQKGKKYLISGRVDKAEGRMRINLCSSIVERTRLSRATRKLKKNPPNCPIKPVLGIPEKIAVGPS